ncbi:MAG TPA: hypothetical protein VLJ58_03555 [Ramlibacter sp.]|nr:hypothetical protein [Ramlibacter sp.]
MRIRVLLSAPLLAAAAGAFAQALPAEGTPTLEGRRNQRVERIHIEDAGSRIDEIRYAGQTQSISVQPKAGVPAYEVQPADMARTRPADHRDGMGAAGGQRFWNVLKF